MNKVLARVLLAAVALPLLFLFTVQLTGAHFFLLNVTCTAAGFVGALEVRALFDKRSLRTFRWLAPLLGASLPAASYLQAIGLLTEVHLLVWVAGVVGVLMVRTIWFNNADDLEALLPRLAASLTVVFYPGIFMFFLSRLTTVEHAKFHLLFLFALVFANDTAAWAVGTLAGKPLGLVISPSKSVAGFVAGFAVSLAVAVAAVIVAPDLVPGGAAGALTLGLLIGAIAIIGDLSESAVKRSAGVKDSGTVMMGRGGLLDSVDSLLLAAPVYYLLIGLLHK
jgi:phosphatidate cytidylyltransferase